MVFPIKTEPTQFRRGSSNTEDSGYGASISTDDRSYTKSSRKSNSKDPLPPPSSFPRGYYHRHSSSRRSQRDDQSDSDRRSVREQRSSSSPRGGDRSSQPDEHLVYGQHGVEEQNRAPRSRDDGRYSQRDDRSTYDCHDNPAPSGTWDGDRGNQSNGEPVHEHSNPGRCPNCFHGGEGHQEIPHYGHFGNEEIPPPRAPEHQMGLSRRDREFADAMGKGIGTMIKAVAHKPTKFHAVSISVKPQTMTWMMKTERVCALCNDWIGRELYWYCKKCKLKICDECKDRQRSCSHTKGHRHQRI